MTNQQVVASGLRIVGRSFAAAGGCLGGQRDHGGSNRSSVDMATLETTSLGAARFGERLDPSIKCLEAATLAQTSRHTTFPRQSPVVRQTLTNQDCQPRLPLADTSRTPRKIDTRLT